MKITYTDKNGTKKAGEKIGSTSRGELLLGDGNSVVKVKKRYKKWVEA